MCLDGFDSLRYVPSSVACCHQVAAGVVVDGTVAGVGAERGASHVVEGHVAQCVQEGVQLKVVVDPGVDAGCYLVQLNVIKLDVQMTLLLLSHLVSDRKPYSRPSCKRRGGGPFIL